VRHLLGRAGPGVPAGSPGPWVSPQGHAGLREGGGSCAGGKTLSPTALTGETLRVSFSALG